MASPNKTRVQVATDPAFSNVIHDVNGAYNTSLQVAEDILPKGINLYARGMHGHPTTGDSSWSTTVQFKIMALWEDWDGGSNGSSFIFDTNSYVHGGTVNMYDDIYVTALRKSDGYIYLVVTRITGTVIDVLGTTKTAWAGSPSLAVLNANKAVVAYQPNSTQSRVFSFKVNEDYTITFGNNHLIHSDAMSIADTICGKITTNRFAVSFRYNSNNWYGIVWVANVDDSLNIAEVTRGYLVTGIYAPTITSISDTAFLISVHHYNGTTYVQVCSLVGNTLSIGTHRTLSGLPVRPVASYGYDSRTILRLSDTSALVIFNTGTVSRVAILTISGTTVTTSSIFDVATNSPRNSNPAIKVEEDLILIQYTNSTSQKVMVAKLRITNGTMTRVEPQENDIIIDGSVTLQPTFNDFMKIDTNRVLLTYGLNSVNSVRMRVLSR